MPDFLPRREGDLALWTGAFALKVGADPGWFAASAAEAAGYVGLQRSFAAAYRVSQNPSTRTPVAVREKDGLREELVGATRSLVGRARGPAGGDGGGVDGAGSAGGAGAGVSSAAEGADNVAVAAGGGGAGSTVPVGGAGRRGGAPSGDAAGGGGAGGDGVDGDGAERGDGGLVVGGERHAAAVLGQPVGETGVVGGRLRVVPRAVVQPDGAERAVERGGAGAGRGRDGGGDAGTRGGVGGAYRVWCTGSRSRGGVR